MDAVQQLPAYQQQEFMKHLEQMQLKDSLTWVDWMDRKEQSRGEEGTLFPCYSGNVGYVLRFFSLQSYHWQFPTLLSPKQHVQQTGGTMLWRVCQLFSIQDFGQIRDFLFGKLRWTVHQDDTTRGTAICRASSDAAEKGRWCGSSHARMKKWNRKQKDIVDIKYIGNVKECRMDSMNDRFMVGIIYESVPTVACSFTNQFFWSLPYSCCLIEVFFINFLTLILESIGNKCPVHKSAKRHFIIKIS